MEEGAQGFRSLLAYGPPVPVSAESRPRAPDDEPEVQDVLNAVLPPRQFINEKRQMYIECVLSTAATPADVLALHAELVARLRQRRARAVGLCPARRDLHAQCLDELIRQVTIGCTQRGLLLVRVRDEYRALLAAYQQLYESALAFGVRKALRAEAAKEQLSREAAAREEGVAALRAEVAQLQAELGRGEEEGWAGAERERTLHEELMASARLKNAHLKEEVERVLAAEA